MSHLISFGFNELYEVIAHRNSYIMQLSPDVADTFLIKSANDVILTSDIVVGLQ